MSESFFLVDVRRGDAFTRFATECVEEILQVLNADGVVLDLEYLRIERVRPLAETESVGGHL